MKNHVVDQTNILEKWPSNEGSCIIWVEVDLVFYDTTTASFCLDFDDFDQEGGVGFRKRGLGKDGTWGPQIVVALAVTREGVPIRSWVFPGNTSDVTTVEKVKSDLRDWKLGRCLFVADAGTNSEENRGILIKGCGKYLLAVRAASVKEVREEVLTRPGRFKKMADNLHIKHEGISEILEKLKIPMPGPVVEVTGTKRSLQ